MVTVVCLEFMILCKERKTRLMNYLFQPSKVNRRVEVMFCEMRICLHNSKSFFDFVNSNKRRLRTSKNSLVSTLQCKLLPHTKPVVKVHSSLEKQAVLSSVPKGAEISLPCSSEQTWVMSRIRHPFFSTCGFAKPPSAPSCPGTLRSLNHDFIVSF